MKIPLSAYDFFGYLAAGFVVLAAVDYGFGQRLLLDAEPKLIPSIMLTFIAYVIGHAVAHLSWWLTEENFVRKVLRSPEETLFKDHQTRWRWAFPGFFEPFPPETQSRVLEKAKKAGIDQPGRGLFFHCHSIAIRQQTTHERLSAFLNMYGFARNVSFGSALATVLLLVDAIVDRVSNETPASGEALFWAGGSFAVAIIMLYRYLKFFRFYTAEVFRVYAETD